MSILILPLSFSVPWSSSCIHLRLSFVCFCPWSCSFYLFLCLPSTIHFVVSHLFCSNPIHLLPISPSIPMHSVSTIHACYVLSYVKSSYNLLCLHAIHSFRRCRTIQIHSFHCIPFYSVLLPFYSIQFHYIHLFHSNPCPPIQSMSI